LDRKYQEAKALLESIINLIPSDYNYSLDAEVERNYDLILLSQKIGSYKSIQPEINTEKITDVVQFSKHLKGVIGDITESSIEKYMENLTIEDIKNSCLCRLSYYSEQYSLGIKLLQEQYTIIALSASIDSKKKERGKRKDIEFLKMFSFKENEWYNIYYYKT